MLTGVAQQGSVQFSRPVVYDCDPMDCSTPGLPVHHQLPELAQTHVHWVGDAIQPSHLLSSPFPPTFNLSQHQGLFQWVSTSHQVAKIWSFSFSISPSNEYLGLISFRIDWFDQQGYFFFSQGSAWPTPRFDQNIDIQIVRLKKEPLLGSVVFSSWKKVMIVFCLQT